ncbi:MULTISPECIES: substrate-binding domain-containing protein [Streptomyces]|uniref:Substrate-binding domain-containing protein n=1 Tax=Streptomyces gilvifuscus TaxID=1550617 RepID=A0ABT5G029_9ACTN|nr:MULTISPECIES: substrate-binding domain-containing protein [Streptomyces]MBK3644714.1 substrate-binding domain-containing protein [Streptomyces sp. MBT33]MDC2958051.1 substrate-binding domain-containing protein [Streptomyces gilvifuscus]
MALIRRRWPVSATALLVASAALAGCGSGDATGSSGTTASVPGLSTAEKKVAALQAAVTDYPVPTTPVRGVAKFKGRKVYYIPFLQQIPAFADAARSMREALAKAGLSQQVCDGKAQPSAIAACVQQAMAANAAGIVLDAIPYGMAQNALDAAKAKGIPIVVADQDPPSGFTNSNQVAYVPGATTQPSAIAWWAIADSKGKADLIITESADNPSATKYVTDSLPIYKKYCPGCTVKVKVITASTPALLASNASSNILANPKATYYFTQFEDSLQPTIQGIQQSGRASGISLAVTAGSVNGLGLLKGNSAVKAVVAVDEAYAAYALTDEILRMMTKSGPVEEPFPTRLFTKQNIGDIKVTAATQASGEWFGNDSFHEDFATLWGLG